MQALEKELTNPDVWNNTKLSKQLNQEKTSLTKLLDPIIELNQNVEDAFELIDLVEGDNEAHIELYQELLEHQKSLDKVEFNRMFSGEYDASNAYLEIQSGSGGTEAQDWAEMLMRMYLRWAEEHSFKVEMLSVASGEVAGVKSANILVKGEYAFGWLRTESGVHRLVRKSPFDSGNRRHTSFASVFITPEVNDDVEVDVNPVDLRIDTYRSSGAGGQHVNTTDSAVRITHVPTGVVVQCQNDRSQHKNKAQAMKQLKAKLIQVAMQEKMDARKSITESKGDITWGHQIRSYVLDQSRIKDLRTGIEITHIQSVLDGGIDPFIEGCLKQGIGDETGDKK